MLKKKKPLTHRPSFYSNAEWVGTTCAVEVNPPPFTGGQTVFSGAYILVLCDRFWFECLYFCFIALVGVCVCVWVF